MRPLKVISVEVPRRISLSLDSFKFFHRSRKLLKAELGFLQDNSISVWLLLRTLKSVGGKGPERRRQDLSGEPSHKESRGCRVSLQEGKTAPPSSSLMKSSVELRSLHCFLTFGLVLIKTLPNSSHPTPPIYRGVFQRLDAAYPLM